MYGTLIFPALVGLAVLLGFVGLWRNVTGRDEQVDERLKEFGISKDSLLDDDSAPLLRGGREGAVAGRAMAGFGLGPRLALSLARADVPMTAVEYGLIILGLGIAGLVLGTLYAGPLVGLVLGAVAGYLPILYLNMRQNRRRRAMTEQIPQVLALLAGALRAGYGLTQALGVLVGQLSPPASQEFARAARAVELGVPVQTALEDIVDRTGSDDLALMVTAINVQYEIGGNLAQTLETIGKTVQERIEMFRQIRVLTAHQRLTGYVLAGTPIFLGIFIYLRNPDYIGKLFEPGLERLLLIGAIVLQLVGFVIIRRILDIEV